MKYKNLFRKGLSVLLGTALALSGIPDSGINEVQRVHAAASEQLPDSCGFIVTGGAYGTDYDYQDNTLKILTDTAITIEGKGSATTDTILVGSGVNANVMLHNVNIDVSGTENAAAFKIEDDSTGNVTVTLSGVNTLKSGKNCAGLQKNGSGNVGKLILKGNGSLTATGGDNAAGIGGGKGGAGSDITISGGAVTATSGMGGAGIGGGYYRGEGSNITISGGTVTATSSGYGAGIGGGNGGAGSDITISGGTVTATGCGYGAGIGGGNNGAGSDITISGGTVTATGGGFSAGIGGGCEGEGSNITISGGTVIATSGYRGAGIGGGNGGAGSNITISGSNTAVFATGGGNSTDNIGSGEYVYSTSDSVNRDGGLIIEGSTGRIYGDVELESDFTIESTVTFDIDGDTSKDSTLTIAQGVTLTNNGTININTGDKLIVNGALVNNGIINNNGTISTGINSVEISITVPTAGSTLDTSSVCDTIGIALKNPSVTYKTGSETASGTVQYDMEYTAAVVLETDDGYVFKQDISVSDVTVNGNQAASVTLEADGTLFVTYTFPKTAKAKLQSITAPEAVTGVANGTAKTADALGLPKKVTIATEDTKVTSADVTWDLDNLADGTYEPSVPAEQTFTVNGTVTLPEGIDQNGVSLATTISVTVAESLEPIPTPTVPPTPTPVPPPTVPPTPTPTSSPSPETVSETELEKNAAVLHDEQTAVRTGDKLILSWGRVKDADGYYVYVQYCGRKFTPKSRITVKDGTKRKLTVTKINKKKLKGKKNIKFYVAAYRKAGKKKVIIGKTLRFHTVSHNNPKYTDVKKVRVKKKSYRLKKGQTAQIMASVVLVNPDKKELSSKHAKRFRYATSNKNVAAVSEKGKIRAVRKGRCTIYVIARNGRFKKIRVKVNKGKE